MKRFLASALVLGSLSGFGLVGCGDETKVKESVSTPTGSAEKTTTVKTTGDGAGAATPAK